MKFKIILERDTSIFDDIKGISKVYGLTKQKALFETMTMLFNGWQDHLRVDNKIIYFEEGGLSFVEKEKAKWEKFIFGTDKEIYKNEKYNRIKRVMNDRGVKGILNKIKRIPKRIKDKAIGLALDEGTVMMFFIKMGIIVTWEIEKDKK